jgi:coenzyme F420-dependent glucose-6-phosphate dehydrogenase
MERLATLLPVERTASRWIVLRPEEHVEKIRPYSELGFSHLRQLRRTGQARFLRLYAERVLPLLQAPATHDG